MTEKIFVIGHTSPDLDSVAAAIAYAYFKNTINRVNYYIPVTAGKINEETRFSLEKFKIPEPEIIKDLKNKNIILVDHNEFIQSAEGIEEAKIIGILDHHKINFKYSNPINFITKPWGASCSIIAQKFFDSNIKLSTDMAGLLLSAILVDTVITKSPTCTAIDRQIITKLAQFSRIKDWKKFGMELFRVRSSVKDLKAEEIIKSDFKEYSFKDGVIGVGQVETVDLNDFSQRGNELLTELNRIQEKEGYHSVILFVTDIIQEGSQFFVATSDITKMERALNSKLEEGKVYIRGIISRKKQVMPKLTKIFDE